MNKDRPVNDHSIAMRNPDVVARELAAPEGGVLLNLKTGAYHGLNPTGLMIWNSVDGQRTLAQLVETLRGQFEDPPESLRTDVVSFLEGAIERDLVRLSGSPNSPSPEVR